MSHPDPAMRLRMWLDVPYRTRVGESPEQQDLFDADLRAVLDAAIHATPFVRVEFLAEDGNEVQRFDAKPGWTEVTLAPRRPAHSVRVLVRFDSLM